MILHLTAKVDVFSKMPARPESQFIMLKPTTDEIGPALMTMTFEDQQLFNKFKQGTVAKITIEVDE